MLFHKSAYKVNEDTPSHVTSKNILNKTIENYFYKITGPRTLWTTKSSGGKFRGTKYSYREGFFYP